MDTERKWLGHPKEFYTDLHRNLVSKARGWFETGKNTTIVNIDEDSLESHFEANWAKDAENYRNEIHGWRGNGELKDLKVIQSESGQKSYLLDTSDFVVAKPEDCLFFYMMGTCWAVVVDFERAGGELLRAGYHLPGTTVNKNYSISSMCDELGSYGEVKRISVFFNGYKDVYEDIEEVKAELPPSINSTFINIKHIVDWSAQDIFVTRDEAEIFHNEGDYDLEKDESVVKRVLSGKCKVFEANI